VRETFGGSIINTAIAARSGDAEARHSAGMVDG
jgi:hypothetical protein